MKQQSRQPSLADRWILICHLRAARRKARGVAALEVLCLLQDLAAAELQGGPLAEQPSLFWVTLPTSALETAIPRLSRLGYTSAVDLLEPLANGSGNRQTRSVRWRGNRYRLVRIYEEDPADARERAVDRRTFLLATSAGVRPTRGYRGNSQPLSRRGLPVADARLLINLLGNANGRTLLDPFAGTGGVVLEALAAGWQCLSVDIDRDLRFGLAEITARHCIADIRALPFAAASVDAVATEPPYDPEAAATVQWGLREVHRALRPGGRVALLCAAWQASQLRSQATELNFATLIEAPVNRKGLAVIVFAWQKSALS